MDSIDLLDRKTFTFSKSTPLRNMTPVSIYYEGHVAYSCPYLMQFNNKVKDIKNMNVIWKELNIDNYGILKVSNTGQVFSLKANKELSKRVKKDKYLYVRILSLTLA